MSWRVYSEETTLEPDFANVFPKNEVCHNSLHLSVDKDLSIFRYVA
jgi:hypothetical protein